MLEKVRLVNRMRFRLKRRKISTRLFQIVVVTAVLTLFLYLLFQAGLSEPPPAAPDYAWLSTRNLSHFIRPQEETALVQPAPCVGDETKLLVVVFSAPSNWEARKAVRRTWGQRFATSPHVRILFILGKPDGQEDSQRLRSEAEEFSDILQEDFRDTYLNLTLKTTFMLKWASKACTGTKYVFKLDDDVHVNSDRMWQLLESSHLYFKNIAMQDFEGNEMHRSVDYALIGHVMNTVPIRDPVSKWYLPPAFYPLNIFPKFLSGTGYIFTGSLLSVLYNCALRTPYVNLEDVFLTGLCATTQLGLRLTHSWEFQWRPMAVGGSHACNFKQSVLVHGPFEPHQLQEIWDKTQDDLLCDTLLFSIMSHLSAVIAFVRNIFRF